MASCIWNICAKNYQNLIIDFQVTVENVGDVFWDTVYKEEENYFANAVKTNSDKKYHHYFASIKYSSEKMYIRHARPA